MKGLIPLENRGELLGWEAVGRVDLPNGYCTGALVAPDLVLTAAHCVHDRLTGERLESGGILFRAGYRNGEAVAIRSVRRIATPRDYDANPTARLKAEMVRKDVALLMLDSPISTVLADPFTLHSQPERGERVSVVSYGRGREEMLSWQKECAVTERFPGGLMAFDCNVTFGSSGAPVLARDGSRRRILSLISAGGNTPEGDPVSYGMHLLDVVTDLRQQLKRDLRAVPATPGWRKVTAGQRSATPGMKRVVPGVRNGSSGAKFIRP